MRYVGLIPARADSKRLPRKNLSLLRGRPLLGYTCEAALRSSVLDAVYVNTDSPEIAALAIRFGVRCPRLRPASLASDEATTQAANAFLLNVLRERGEAYEAVVVLQPTSPLRTADDIRRAVEIYEMNSPCAVVSVSRVAPAHWLGTVGKDGRFDPFAGSEPVFSLNGAVYVFSVEDYLANRQPSKTLVYPMPAERGVDIDTYEDLRHAEILLERMQFAVAG